jgi:hypothetical protein
MKPHAEYSQAVWCRCALQPAKDPHWRQPHDGDAYGLIRLCPAHQLGFQPLGLQAGAWFVPTLGQLGPRRVRWGVVIHDESRVLFAQPIFSRHYDSVTKPVGAVEAHLSYDVKPRFWFSLDGNYWYGGRTSLNGVEDLATLQANSRIGATASVPITKRQSLKFSYSNGAIARYGGNYQNVSAAWQYS